MKYISPKPFLFLFAATGLLSAQITVCVPTANIPIVRAEGITERVGDIVYACTGLANSTVTVNYTVALNTSVTNTIASGSTLTGLVFTADTGAGPQPVLMQPLLGPQNTVVYNGVSFTFSPQGTATLRLSGIRVNATQVAPLSPIIANLAITAGGLLLTSAQLAVGTPERGLYVGYSTNLVCAQNGSPLPASINFASLILSGTSFATTRVTEGFSDALAPRAALANSNAQTGERIIVNYSGFPSDARLFVPDAVAGSDAIQPTAGGDFELPASGGAYAPSVSGSLLLARVAGANASGAGGNVVYTPGAVGSGTVAFNTVNEIPIVNGSAYVVYEVVDANPALLETAQFPTFLGLLPNGSRTASETSETVFLAPQSKVTVASTSEPVPRFAAVTPQQDCTILGDCAAVLGQLSVDATPLSFTEPSGGPTGQQYFAVRNIGGGLMQWTALVSNGAVWLSLDSYSGVNTTTVRVYAAPGSLPPGTYHATITVTTGAASGGPATVQVTFVVTAAAPTPTITDVLNAASLAAVPVVPGSLSAVKGSAFTGKTVTAAFDGLPATILFSDDTQINLMVPAELASKTSAQLVVTVDAASASRTVTLAPFEPAIFPGAVLNQDLTVNGASNGASAGSVVVLWATGLSGAGTITGHIADRDIPAPYYAGPAPGLIGVQQVNLGVPADLAAMTTQLYVCGTSTSATVCSLPVPLTLK
jgi:uncharacterized protein (TIGR03437 family)